MLRKFIVTGIAMTLVNSLLGQDSSMTPTLSITGSTDLYYRYDFGQTKANNLTSFTNSHNAFELGMASVRFDYKASRVQLVADVGFGKRAQEFSYNDDGFLAGIKQLYISYAPSEWLKLTGGSWATHVGYELVDPYANRNYSMSYMFTNGPFFHTGIKAEAAINSSGFMIGLANPTDYKYVPFGVLNKKVFLAQYSFTPGDYFKAYLNFLSGDNVDTTKSSQLDLVLTSRLNDQLSIGYNGTVNRTKLYLGNKVFDKSKNWWGSALYINYDVSNAFGFTLREEFFSDGKQLKMFSSQLRGGNILASTLSANIRTDHFVLIPEFRLDRASEAIFFDQNEKPVKWTANILLAAVYQF